jgi:hypothetical protein
MTEAGRGSGQAARFAGDRDWQPLPDGRARPDERQSHYSEVACEACGAVVRAAKFSFQHTSVQWDAVAVRQCAEFARRAARGEQTPLIERCASMRASIEAAAADGRLPVAPPWSAEPWSAPPWSAEPWSAEPWSAEPRPADPRQPGS